MGALLFWWEPKVEFALSRLGVLPHDPCGHAALILNDGGLQRIEQLAAQIVGEPNEKSLIDEIAFDAVGGEEAAAVDALVLHADGGGEAAEEEAAGFEDSPDIAQHSGEVLVVAREVEHGAAEHDVGEGVWEGHGFDGLDAEVVGRERRCEQGGEGADALDGNRVFVYAEDFASLAQKIDEVAAEAAARVDDAHARGYVAAQKLIEEVDVDSAELLLKGGDGWHRKIIRDCAG